jgi:hypothetical protein
VYWGNVDHACREETKTVNISHAIKAAAVVALLGFSLYMAHQNKDDRIRRQWKNIIAAIVLVYLAGKFIDEFALI